MISALRITSLFSPKAILFFTMVFTLAYFFLAHEGFYFDDDYAYADMAGKLAHGEFNIRSYKPDLPAYHRFLIFGPTAFFYKILGVNIYTTTLWPLLCTLASLAFIYLLFRKEDKWLTTFALLLLGLNFHTLFLSTYFFPDNIAMFFGLLAAGILCAARCLPFKPIGFALAFVLANFAALLSKETIIWYLPFYLLVAAADFFRKRNTVFWLWAAGLGILVLGSYLLFYKLSFGGWFYRFTMVEDTNLIMGDNYITAGAKSIFPRLVYEPIIFLIGSGIFLPFAFCLRFFHGKNIRQIFSINHSENFWFWLASLVLLQFWFGSTSVNFYNPITLIPRMATLLFPPLCIAAAYQLRNFFHDRTGALWFAIPLLLAAVYARSAMSLVYGLPGLYFAFVYFRFNVTSQIFKPAYFALVLVFASILRPLHFMWKPSNTSFIQQEEIIENFLQNPVTPAVVYVDGWLEKSTSYYFNFEPHPGVTVRNYDDFKPEYLANSGNTFLLVNSSTLTNPDWQYNPPKPRFSFTEAEIYRRFPNRKLIAEKGAVKLYQAFR